MRIRDRIKELRRVPARELIPHARNWRIHPKAQQDALRGILAEVGWADAVLAYETPAGLRLIDGHLRAETAPDAEVPVLVLDVNDEEAAKILATHDPITAMAGKDEENLRELLEGIEVESEALQGMLDDLVPLTVVEGLVDPDDVPAAPAEATTQRGDLWRLGGHRLLCGDSAAGVDVDRLLAGELVHLVNTDPPYNVRVEPRSNNAIAAAVREGRVLGRSARTSVATAAALKHTQSDLVRRPNKSRPTGPMRPKDRPLDNDWIGDREFDDLLRAWFGNIARVLGPGRSFYIWAGYSNVFNYPQAILDAGLYFSQILLWVKGHPVLTRKDYMGDHESCYYGWQKGAAHYFNPQINNATDVWSVKKVSPQKMVHLTEKPAELAARAMEYSSRRGENVLDLFGGSGSTLIAAEQTGRRCFLMEIDPLYCDVIVERWERFTGRKAERCRGIAS